MTDNQVRKAINVSLQSKKYSESINEIIKDWEEQDLNISAETCEALLLVHRLKKLSSLSNIFNIVKMLDNLASIYHYDDSNIDNMLNQIIHIDNEKFSQILIELNNMKFTSNEKVKEKNITKDKTKDITEDITSDVQETSKVQENKFESNKEIVETVKTKEIKIEKNNEIEEEEEKEEKTVPLDFLFNS